MGQTLQTWCANKPPPLASGQEMSSEALKAKHDALKSKYVQAALPPPKPVNHHRRVVAGADSGVTLSLVPHEHSLFCERKERVCTSVGKLQEHEKLRVKSRTAATQDLASRGVWTRSAPGVLAHLDGHEEGSLVDTADSFVPIPGSEGHLEYELTVDDVGCYISFRVVVEQGQGQGALQAEAVMGPVLAGPPRLLDLTVSGSLELGTAAVAEADYIGGKPGASEFWWLRIRQGEREQLSEPRAIQAKDANTVNPALLPKDDPRVHIIGPQDLGCVLKVKCRPVRFDGHKGEVFTSKPSKVVGGTPVDSSQLVLSSSSSSSAAAGREGEAGGL